MDADDLMHRDRLAVQTAALEAAPHLAAVGAHVRFFPRAGMSDGLRAYERWLASIDSPARLRADAFVECPVAHPTLAVRRPGLARLGYRGPGVPGSGLAGGLRPGPAAPRRRSPDRRGAAPASRLARRAVSLDPDPPGLRARSPHGVQGEFPGRRLPRGWRVLRPVGVRRHGTR